MEKKASKNILLFIMGLLIILEIVITVYECIFGMMIPAYSLMILISLIGVALYGFWLYKKPHGNMLKYAMLLSALSIIVSVLISMYQWEDPFIENFLPIFAACLMFYVAGRLNRIEQNKYLLVIIELVLLVGCIIEMVSISTDTVAIVIRYHIAPRYLITFTTLMIAYFVRYKEHKEAGLADAPKK